MRSIFSLSRRRLGAGLAVAFGLMTLISAWAVVPPGHVGVVNRLGAVQMNHRPEGFHFKAPFIDGIEKIDVRLRGADKQASASSKDLQVVTTRVTVQYSLTGPVTPLTYQKIGNRAIVESTLIDPAIQES